MSSSNPFSSKIPGHPEIQAVDAASRIRMVDRFTIKQCNAALQIRGLQKTVVLALFRRVRKVKQQCKP